MPYLLAITADHNYADYITKNTIISEREAESPQSLLHRASKALCDFSSANPFKMNWSNGEHARTKDTPIKLYDGVLSQEYIDKFEDYLPNSEYGIHTISRIELYKIETPKQLLQSCITV